MIRTESVSPRNEWKKAAQHENKSNECGQWSRIQWSDGCLLASIQSFGTNFDGFKLEFYGNFIFAFRNVFCFAALGRMREWNRKVASAEFESIKFLLNVKETHLITILIHLATTPALAVRPVWNEVIICMRSSSMMTTPFWNILWAAEWNGEIYSKPQTCIVLWAHKLGGSAAELRNYSIGIRFSKKFDLETNMDMRPSQWNWFNGDGRDISWKFIGKCLMTVQSRHSSSRRLNTMPNDHKMPCAKWLQVSGCTEEMHQIGNNTERQSSDR